MVEAVIVSQILTLNFNFSLNSASRIFQEENQIGDYPCRCHGDDGGGDRQSLVQSA
jgi:hypothetical protein